MGCIVGPKGTSTVPSLYFSYLPSIVELPSIEVIPVFGMPVTTYDMVPPDFPPGIHLVCLDTGGVATIT